MAQGEFAHPQEHQGGVEPVGRVEGEPPPRVADADHDLDDIDDSEDPILTVQACKPLESLGSYPHLPLYLLYTCVIGTTGS